MICGRMWRGMGEGGKRIWMLRAKQEREAYNKEYAEWLENGGAEAIENVKSYVLCIQMANI